MREHLKQLDSWLTQNSDKIRYGNPLTEEDIRQFEADNKCLLPEDLHELYCWNNGIAIDDNFRFLSLQEAFRIYQSETTEINPVVFVDKLESLSTEDARLFQEEFEKHNKTSEKDSGFWLPIFVSRTVSASSYYALWLSEIKKENPDWVLIESKTYPQPFHFKFGRESDGQTLNFYAKLPALLADSLHKLNPPKTTIGQDVKGIFQLIGRLFERW